MVSFDFVDLSFSPCAVYLNCYFIYIFAANLQRFLAYLSSCCSDKSYFFGPEFWVLHSYFFHSLF
jgi:hypothetical protein